MQGVINKIMKKFDKIDYSLALVLLILIVLLIGLNKCNRKEKTFMYEDIQKIDSLNAVLDSLDDHYTNNLLKWTDSIEFYKSALERKKTVFKTKYILQSKIDTLILQGDYEQCCYDANDIILLQDSLIQVYDTALLACNNRVVNLKNQVKENKIFIKEIKVINPKHKRQRNFLGVLSLVLLGAWVVR